MGRVRPSRRARLASWLVDYAVVVAWLVVVLLVVGVPTLEGWVDLTAVWSRAWAADVAVTVLTVLPHLGYLVVTEAGPHRATWGKRRAGLVVVLATGAVPAPVSRVLLRNAVKVVPWQLGHMSAMRFAEGTDPVPAEAVWLYAGSLAVLLAVALPPLLGRPGVHDLLAGTQVRPRGTVGPTAPHLPR
ncbi:RDD family protein [Aquipuribacter sp. MA13-6]|uniref:RDD family protein n=1 Tax=unclassified Aquipuribacter TaxID=2635084 RepID=UPI003EEFB0C0